MILVYDLVQGVTIKRQTSLHHDDILVMGVQSSLRFHLRTNIFQYMTVTCSTKRIASMLGDP